MEYKGVGIEWLGGSSFCITKDDVVMLLNPLEEQKAKVDCILLSTISPLDVDITIIASLLKPEGKVIVQEAFCKVLKTLKDEQILILEKNIVQRAFGMEFEMTFVDNATEKQNGFLIRTPEVRIYFAGDTHFTPEMNLIECDVALLPISGHDSMDFDEAASAVNILVPELVIPYKYSKKDFENAQRFANIAKEITEVEIMEPKEE